MATKNEQEVTITGYLGKVKDSEKINYNYKAFEDSGKSAITASIRPSGKDAEWVQFKAWNVPAERIREGIENEGIEKLTITGKYKEVTFDTAKGPKTIQELQVSQLQKHKVMEITGNIAKIEEKETKNKKAYTELLIINEGVKDGKGVKSMYEVTIWAEKKAGIPKDLELKNGAAVAIKGEATILENASNTEKYTKVNAWNVDKNLKSLHAQIEAKVEASKTKDAEKAKAPKAKGKGVEM